MKSKYNFALAIRTLRKEARLTQEELAKKSEVSRSSIAHYEIGSKIPGADKLDMLAYGLGVDICRIYEIARISIIDLEFPDNCEAEKDKQSYLDETV